MYLYLHELRVLTTAVTPSLATILIKTRIGPPWAMRLQYPQRGGRVAIIRTVVSRTYTTKPKGCVLRVLQGTQNTIRNRLGTRADGYPNPTIRLGALTLYLGDPLLRFDSILDKNVPELDKIVSTA